MFFHSLPTSYQRQLPTHAYLPYAQHKTFTMPSPCTTVSIPNRQFLRLDASIPYMLFTLPFSVVCSFFSLCILRVHESTLVNPFDSHPYDITHSLPPLRSHPHPHNRKESPPRIMIMPASLTSSYLPRYKRSKMKKETKYNTYR